jgi:hypothetical protein
MRIPVQLPPVTRPSTLRDWPHRLTPDGVVSQVIYCDQPCLIYGNEQYVCCDSRFGLFPVCNGDPPTPECGPIA